MNGSTARFGVLLAATFVLALLPASCKDSATEPSGEITSDEAEWLFISLGHLFGDGGLGDDSSGGGSNIRIECPAGGWADAAVTPEDSSAGDTARIGVTAVLTPSDCTFIGEGYALTLNGDPNVVFQVTVSFVGPFEDLTIESVVEGTLAWEIADRAGTCDIDMRLSAKPDLSDPNFTANYVGTVCGFELEIAGVWLEVPGAGVPGEV